MWQLSISLVCIIAYLSPANQQVYSSVWNQNIMNPTHNKLLRLAFHGTWRNPPPHYSGGQFQSEPEILSMLVRPEEWKERAFLSAVGPQCFVFWQATRHVLATMHIWQVSTKKFTGHVLDYKAKAWLGTTVWIQPFNNVTMKLGMITVSWLVTHFQDSLFHSLNKDICCGTNNPVRMISEKAENCWDCLNSKGSGALWLN